MIGQKSTHNFIRERQRETETVRNSLRQAETDRQRQTDIDRHTETDTQTET